MEVPQQAATEESSSQNRAPANKNKHQNSDCTGLLESKSESSLQVPVRRSLRIFAKQKLEEEKQQSSTTQPVKQGAEVGLATSSESTGSGRKRVRSDSPKSAETPRKQVKSGPVRKRLKEAQSTENSVSPVSVSVSKSDQKKGWSSKLDKEGDPKTAGKHSRSEGEESDKAVQKRRKKATKKQKQKEQTSSDTEASLKSQAKSKGKGRYKGRYRLKQGGGKFGWKTGYHSSLFKITMASPGNTDPVADSTEGEGAEDVASQEERQTSGVFQENLRSRYANEAGQLSSGEEPSLEPFLSMDEGTRRMHGIPGLPHHLLGALGSKMYMMHKTFSNSLSSSNNSRAQQLLTGIETAEDEGLQLQSCIEMGQLLVMGNEETLSGFPVKQAVPALVKLLSMEHNFDMMVNACRALTYMMEALPRSSVIVANAIPVLVEKLQVIQCMDVAEQALSALEILSKRHGKAILQAGGLTACLLYLDFFSIGPQRSALSIASHCCQTVMEDFFPLVKDALPILTGRLQHQDKRSVESCCHCFSRLVDSFSSNKAVLEEVASSGLLPSLQQLLVVSPPVISSAMFVTVLKMMSTLCATCPTLAVQLLRLNIADTLRYLLVGSGEITLENIELMTRSPAEVYEILSLASEMMPPLPCDGVFEVEEWLNIKRQLSSSVLWEWQESASTWRPYGRLENKIIESTYQAHEDECSVGIMGNVYIVDLSGMQQINEDTGTTRAVRRTIVEPPKKASLGERQADERAVALKEDPSLGSSFTQALFGVLYEVFNSMAGPAVRIRCLKTILRILYHTDSSVLFELLKDIGVSSHLAAMLKAQDYRLVVGAMQMAEVLMHKLPAIFSQYFYREGVVHQLQSLRDIPLQMLATPKQEGVGRLGLGTVPPAAVAAPLPSLGAPVIASPSSSSPLSSSTRKRLSEMFKKGKRHFRKTMRGRGEDQEPGAVASPSAASPPVISPPVPKTSKGVPEERPFPFPNLHALPVMPGEGSGAILVGGGAGIPSSLLFGGSGDLGGENAHKERIQKWIQEQATGFLEKWSGLSSGNPTHAITTRLKEATEGLDYKSPACLVTLDTLFELLVDPDSNISAFEFMHYQVHTKLLHFLTLDSTHASVSLKARLRHFLHVFMGLPEGDVSLDSFVERTSSGHVCASVLLSKLHGCINQLEQFPVRVHEFPGRRGSHALRFFSSHQIKCTLERHPSAKDTNPWKGGMLRIDPLATVQTLERYLLARGFGKVGDPGARGARRMDDDSEDSEVDEAVVLGLSGHSTDKHSIEFLMGDKVLPYNLTIFQAIKQHGLESSYREGEEENTPLGRPEIWIHSHKLYYRVIPGSDKKGHGSSLKQDQAASGSSAAPPAPQAAQSPSTSASSRKLAAAATAAASGYSSSRQRGGRSSSKNASPTQAGSSLPVRVTRSGSGYAKTPSASKPPEPPSRITRSNTANLPILPSTVSAARIRPSQAVMSVQNMDGVKEKTKNVRLSPLQQALKESYNLKLVSDDPSLPALKLFKVLYALNTHWTDAFPGLAGNPLLPMNDFINNKLTAKATRQLQDPLNVITGNFPSWLRNLASNCMFLFPFDCRQTLFYLSTFDRDRAIARLQDQRPDISPGDPQQTVTPRLEKKKRCVSRENMLKQAEKLMDELASTKALLEIHYEDEVGTGLGPTLEFYALVSRELQRSDLMLFRGDLCPMPGPPSIGASTTPQYIHSPSGLFPCPLGPNTKPSEVDEVCAKFRFMGKLMAKAIMDSRMLDISLSEAFYKWMLGLEDTFTAQDLQHVDPTVARSFAQLAAVAVKKHSLERDPLLTGKALAVGIESLTLEGGGSVEDVDLDFTLPGCSDIELKPGGKDIAVTIHNLDEYLKLVVDWSLVRGVVRQMEAFKEGFNSVFPLSSMHGLLHPSEMDMMICGAHLQKWDIKDLMEYCRADHGYSHDSRAIQFLFEVLSGLESAEQRQFIQFVTGSPRLPVGGFKALSPQLTIVRKTVEPPHNPDDFLPSVMTCVNYLKLPDYSTVAIMKERLHFALQEGKHSFHLS